MIENISFNDNEKKLIINTSIDLINHGYFTAINLIHSELKPLPDDFIIIHYLQESENQIKYIVENIKKYFSYSENDLIKLPRLTIYGLDPKYTKKPHFKEEYQNAIFLSDELKRVDIEEVISAPFNKIVCRDELDLLIPLHTEINLVDIANFILSKDREGPEPWIDPAVIIKSEIDYNSIENFIKKDYCSIRKGNTEFYTIIFNKIIKSKLRKFLKRRCKEIEDFEIKLDKDSILFLRGFINQELDSFIYRNLYDFKPLL